MEIKLFLCMAGNWAIPEAPLHMIQCCLQTPNMVSEAIFILVFYMVLSQRRKDMDFISSVKTMVLKVKTVEIGEIFNASSLNSMYLKSIELIYHDESSHIPYLNLIYFKCEVCTYKTVTFPSIFSIKINWFRGLSDSLQTLIVISLFESGLEWCLG